MSLREKKSKGRILAGLIEKFYDRIYIVDLNTKEWSKITAEGEETEETGNYDDWLIRSGESMYRPEAAAFFAQMDLKHICVCLKEQGAPYTVHCRLNKEGTVYGYELLTDYLDADRDGLVILCRRLSERDYSPLQMQQELEHDRSVKQFLVNQLLETVLEIKVNTGQCRMVCADNGMVKKDTFKEQVDWLAENVIAEEDRSRFRNEYELNNLINSLRRQEGYHSAMYTAGSKDAQRNFTVVSALVHARYGEMADYIYSYFQDVTVLKEHEVRNKQLVDISQQLLAISQTETLTGLYNRAAGECKIEECLNEEHCGGIGTMLLMDIDNFKMFNDQYGHQTGDFVLKYLSKTLKQVFRSNDILCRWGGDEFVIFMQEICDENSIVSRIERLRARMKQCMRGDAPMSVTLSIGGTAVSRPIELKELFEHCDQALYKVKEEGRDGYHILYDS